MSQKEAEYIDEIYGRLKRKFGPVSCPLHYQEPYQLCVAVILSAQCTDEMVNRVTPELFKAFPDPRSLAEAPVAEVERLIHSTGFYRNKARNIQGFCRALVNEHGGQVPQTIEELIKMPGVGRKTANVVLQELYGISNGFVVDTHVLRLSRLLGLSHAKDAVRMEKDLMQKVPPKYWMDLSLYLIFLGRSACVARRPRCTECVLSDVCPSSTVESKRPALRKGRSARHQK